jgi:hypothetical protein
LRVSKNHQHIVESNTMKQHRYHISVKEIADTPGQTPGKAQPIEFAAASHDDLHEIVARTRELGIFDDESATAFAIGLKLFGNVMLTHRDHPLFAEFAPRFGEFMRTLKSQGASRQP